MDLLGFVVAMAGVLVLAHRYGKALDRVKELEEENKALKVVAESATRVALEQKTEKEG